MVRPRESLLQALTNLGAGEIVARRCEAWLNATLLRFANGREVLAIERTYRFGLSLIPDPTVDEIEVVLSGDLCELWNSERAEPLHFVV